MSLLEADPDPADPQRVAIEANRTVDRLRSLTSVRLGATLAEGGSRAARTFGLAQEIADRTATLTDRPQRRLPRLPDSAAGDVLAVCVTDLLEALRAQGDRGIVAEGSRDVTRSLVALRSLL